MAANTTAAITVRIPTQLRTITGGAATIEVEASSVVEALTAVVGLYPDFNDRLFDDSGSLRRFVNVFVAEEDIRFLSGLDTPLHAGQTVSIIPAVAGG